LSRYGYTIADLSAIDVENNIDDYIDTVNSDAGTSIGYMTGTAGSKTVTVTEAQNAALKPLIQVMLREVKKTSLSNSSSTSGSSSTNKSVNMGPVSFSEGGSIGTAISAASAINNAANSPLLLIYNKAIDRLRGRSCERY
jgi:hypothetical protein